MVATLSLDSFERLDGCERFESIRLVDRVYGNRCQPGVYCRSTVRSAFHRECRVVRDIDGPAVCREWAQEHPDDASMRYAQALAYAAMGKVTESTKLFEEIVKQIAASGESEAAANTLAISAEINSEMGRAALAEKESGEALKLAKNQIVLGLGALIASRQRNEKRTRIEW